MELYIILYYYEIIMKSQFVPPFSLPLPVVVDQRSVLGLGDNLGMRQTPPCFLLAEVQEVLDLRNKSVASAEHLEPIHWKRCLHSPHFPWGALTDEWWWMQVYGCIYTTTLTRSTRAAKTHIVSLLRLKSRSLEDKLVHALKKVSTGFQTLRPQPPGAPTL